MHKSILTAAAIALCTAAAPALASDHLANAATAPGADQRGFTNPVAGNPSGVSGPASDPRTVPGEGNPNFGRETGTPAVNRDLVDDRKARGRD